MYTGGTTGFPGVPLTHTALLENVLGTESQGTCIAASGDIVMQGAPLFHILGLGAVCLPRYAWGDTVILPPRVNLDGLMSWIQRYRTFPICRASFFRMLQATGSISTISARFSIA
jgi:acyl-CoA synthetase (AMP-forming)/AMP-acid ligase II